MSRVRTSLTVAAILASGLASTGAAPAAAAGDPAKELPAAGCQTLADGPADAQPAVVLAAAKLPNDPDLDILGLTLRTTATSLVGYIKVTDLAAGPSSTDGHRYSINFTFNGHVFSLSGSAFKNGTGAVRDGLSQTGQAGKTTQLGIDVPSLTAVPPVLAKGFVESGLKVTFDQTGNYVVMELPLADVAKYGGKPFSGLVTNLDARSAIDLYAISSIADTTTPENAGTAPLTSKWTAGDNRCFPSRLALSVAKLPATRTVTAKLTTASGAPLAGETVTFYLNGKRYSAVRTAANGTAVLKNVKPGFTVKAVFAGAGYGGSTASKKV